MGSRPPVKKLRSLDVVLDEVRDERAAQLRHFESLDAKAGIVLGFAGAITTLAPAQGVLIGMGRGSAAIAGLLALWAFLPRNFQVADTSLLRRRYLASEPEFTKLRLLDTLIEMITGADHLLQGKARRLKSAMVALAVAVALVAAGIQID